MGHVLVLHNPFDLQERDTFRVDRPMTIRRFVSRRAGLRPHTTVRRASGRRVRDFVKPTVCVHNGRPVLRREWSRTVIGKGDVVVFQTMPAGSNFSPLTVVAVIAMVAIAVAAPYLAGALVGTGGLLAGTFLATSVGTTLLTAGIGMALSAAVYGVMSLFVQAPPTSNQSTGGSFGGTSAQASPTYSLAAQGNSARLGQPIPELFGRHRVFPDYAHEPYQTFGGNNQYLHCLLVCTKGEMQLESFFVGDTPAQNFPEIEWELVEPGAVVPTALVDTMMLTSHDLAEAELFGSDATPPSPWVGPFIVNPTGTTITEIQIDYAAPQGLYFGADDGNLAAKSFTIELETQTIDDDGVPTGAWVLTAGIFESMATRTPQRWTYAATVGQARYQVRMRRTDPKDTSARAANAVHWIGLRGHQPGARTFPGVTLIAVRARATGNLTGASSRQFNFIGTRKLPTWDAGAGAMTTATTATRNPCDAFAYICLSQNGARLVPGQVDLAGLYAHAADYAARSWTFDAVFDTSSSCWEAVSKIGRCVVAQPVVQGPRVRLVRDLPSTAPAMVFSPRNIRKGTFKLKYKFPDEKTADAVVVEYIDRRSWKPRTVTCALEGISPENPATVQLFGCSDREQARAFGFNLIRANKYRRRVVPFGTEMEGLLLLYGDAIRVSHDMPKWGQAAEAIAFDPSSRVLVVDQELDFSAGGAHYAALRRRDGNMAGPYEAVAVPGNPHAIVLGAGALPELSLGGDAERTHVVFGPGQAYAKPLKVIGVTPRTLTEVDIMAIDDDPAMYAPIPPE